MSEQVLQFCNIEMCQSNKCFQGNPLYIIMELYIQFFCGSFSFITEHLGTCYTCIINLIQAALAEMYIWIKKSI